MNLQQIENSVRAEKVCDHEKSGWCKCSGKCKFKSRVYEEGPRGGKRKTDSYCCMKAL